MNRIVQSWDRSQRKVAVPGPDALTVGEDVFEFQETEMPIVKELRPEQFDSLIRMIKKVGLERVRDLRTATYRTLKRLEVKRDESKFVPGIPKGSDQHNIRTVLVWLDKIKPGDAKAMEQLVAIDATATRRIKV